MGVQTEHSICFTGKKGEEREGVLEKNIYQRKGSQSDGASSNHLDNCSFL